MAIVRIPSRYDLSRLTPRQVEVLQQIAAGKTHAEAARALGIATGTLNQRLTDAGYKLGHGSDATRVHAALCSGQLDCPRPAGDAPNLDTDELALLRAVARFTDRDRIAAEAGLALAELAPRLKALTSKAGAAHIAHLVALGHAWNLLSATTTAGVPTPSGGRTR